MSLKQKVGIGWGVTAQSFGFLGRHKRLFLFPVFSLLLSLVFIVVVAFGVFEVAINTNLVSLGSGGSSSETTTALTSSANSTEASQANQTGGPEDEKTKLLSAAGLVAVFGLYVCIYFVFNFFSVAFAACVLSVFAGKPVGLWGGVSVSAHRLKAILGWSFLVALVGSIASAVESRGTIFTSVISVLGGFAWGLATFFVIPIIAAKNAGPITAIEDSVRLMRQVWGESVVSNLGLRGVTLLVLIVVSGCLALAHLTFGSHGLMLALSILAPLVLAAIFFLSTIGTISRAALYYYAIEHKAPPHFDDETLDKAITRK